MGDKTSIQWTDSTWNPIVGCSIISPACTNCYAMAMAARIERMNPELAHYCGVRHEVKGKPVWTGKVNLAPENKLLKPLRWKKPQRVFVNSMSDLFHESVPDEWIDRVFAIMALAPQHMFQVLTKRPKRMREYFSGDHWSDGGVAQRVRDAAIAFWDQEWIAKKHGSGVTQWPLPHVWLGVTAEDQLRADERIPDLLATSAAVRFVSYEPALGPIDWKRWLPTRRPARRPNGEPFLASHFFKTRCEHCGWVGSSELCGIDSFGDDSDVFCPACAKSICADDLPRLDWVICGGESGPNARPRNPAWARSLRDQCAAAGVAYFDKQHGEYVPVTDGMKTDHVFPTGDVVRRVGKSRADRLLDGREHSEFPR
jgi:protein gp37